MGPGQRPETEGERDLRAERRISGDVWRERIEESLRHGLEAAESVGNREISVFARRFAPDYSGSDTFMGFPFLEDVQRVGEHVAVVVGVPYDTGTTSRAGARYGPRGIRQASRISDGYSFDMGVDLAEALDIVDAGDVFTLPGNIEKSFDQITAAVDHVFGAGTFPVILGDDHSIGFPVLRGLARNVSGNIGIIHLDRHADMNERDYDDLTHGTPWFHATNIPNVPAKNLVQIGLGGWMGLRESIGNARERGTTILTVDDVDTMGVEKTAERALEVAWDGAEAVYLSFDIDSVDPSAAPGTGTPEPGGFTPREALKLLRLVAREGLCGMEVVEVSPPYDVAETTVLLASRAVANVLAELLLHGHLPSRYPMS
ncbi:MAG: agmatinase [Rubrobacteraceae bacterium]|nr:agmatinase [Rubrobacter sp.]